MTTVEISQTKCGKLESGGKTLHCLMSAASEGGLSSSCQNILTTLLREVDVASDWTLDPLLQQNCQVSLTLAKL